MGKRSSDDAPASQRRPYAIHLLPQVHHFIDGKTLTRDDGSPASCVYPLAGIRGAGPRRANRYGLGDKKAYNEKAHESIWKIMQIEHIDNVTTLDDILAIDGVDAIVVGPNDFASSMGKLGKVRDTDVLAAYDKIGEIARKHGKAFGVSTGFDEKTVNEWLDRGINWMSLGFDFQYVLSAAQGTLEGAKGVLKNRLK